MIPYYHLVLPNRLCDEIIFNYYDQVIVSPGSPAKIDTKYKMTDVSLEYKIITQPDLARHIVMEYQSMALLHDRILRDRKISLNKLDTTWSRLFNTTCRSLKGILVLFVAEQSYHRDTSRFYNPKLQKVCIIIEGMPNQLYPQGM